MHSIRTYIEVDTKIRVIHINSELQANLPDLYPKILLYGDQNDSRKF